MTSPFKSSVPPQRCLGAAGSLVLSRLAAPSIPELRPANSRVRAEDGRSRIACWEQGTSIVGTLRGLTGSVCLSQVICSLLDLIKLASRNVLRRFVPASPKSFAPSFSAYQYRSVK